MKKYIPADWFGLFIDGKYKAFIHYFNLFYAGLYQLSYNITHDMRASVNIVFDTFNIVWEDRDRFIAPEHLQDLMHDIVWKNSTTYRKRQIADLHAANTPPAENQDSISEKNEGKIDTGRLYHTMIEEIRAEAERQLYSRMQSPLDQDQVVLHDLVSQNKSLDSIAREKNTTRNAISIMKSRALASIISGLSKLVLLYCCWQLSITVS